MSDRHLRMQAADGNHASGHGNSDLIVAGGAVHVDVVFQAVASASGKSQIDCHLFQSGVGKPVLVDLYEVLSAQGRKLETLDIVCSHYFKAAREIRLAIIVDIDFLGTRG